MKLRDTLVGEKSVVFQTESDKEFRFSRDDNTLTAEFEEDIPDVVQDKISRSEFFLETAYPKKITRYAHDEVEDPRTTTQIAEELGLPEDHRMVRSVEAVTHEIAIDIVVESDTEAYIEAVNNVPLEERQKI